MTSGDTRQRIADKVMPLLEAAGYISQGLGEGPTRAHLAAQLADAVVAVLDSGEPDGVRVSRRDLEAAVRSLAQEHGRYSPDVQCDKCAALTHFRRALSPEPEEPTT